MKKGRKSKSKDSPSSSSESSLDTRSDFTPPTTAKHKRWCWEQYTRTKQENQRLNFEDSLGLEPIVGLISLKGSPSGQSTQESKQQKAVDSEPQWAGHCQ